MTEEEWLTDFAPGPMLEYVGRQASGRKLRLLTCACVRRAWHVLNDRYALGALGLIEDYADGERTEPSVREALQRRASSWQLRPEMSVRIRLVSLAISGLARGLHSHGSQLWWAVGDALSNARCVGDDAEPAAQADLIRDVLGNPFRRATFDVSRLTPLAQDLAQAAYGDRSVPLGELDSARLAVLADALEDGGCVDDGLLSHLRSPGPHVRGCWAVDLVRSVD